MLIESILENAKNPNNFGVLEESLSIFERNPFCGDELTLYLKVNKDEYIENVSFSGKSCALSTASASLFTEFIKNKNIKELHSLNPADVYNIVGLKVNPSRSSCILLCFTAFKEIIIKYDQENRN